MKVILYCIGLKIAEIVAICGILYVAYLIGGFITYLSGMSVALEPIWLGHTLIGIIILFISIAISVGIYNGIRLNWKWAEKLAGKEDK